MAMLIALALLVPAVGRALPPTAQLDRWNEGPAPTRTAGESDSSFHARRDAWLKRREDRMQWNDYNYSANIQARDADGHAVRAHPGKGMAWPNLERNITAADMCAKCRERAIKDGLHAVAWNPGDAIPAPPQGENLIALGATGGKKGEGADYHSWRLNGDGSWSHKPGSTPAKTTYTDSTGAEKPFTDPRDPKQRNGYDLCGFLSVSKTALPNIGPLAAAPACTPSSGAVLVQSVAPSGFPDPQKVLTPGEASQLMSHLPTFAPGNRVSDPQWVPLPAGQYQGWYVMTGASGYGTIPPDMRAYLGTVEVARAWPDTEGVEFYHDDQGLENFLGQTVLGQPMEACPNGSTDQPLTACQCSDEALGGGATVTVVSLFEADPVSGGVRLRWRYGDPLQIAGAMLERAASASGPWSRVATEPQEKDGAMQVVDIDVQPDQTYWYQLVVTLTGGGQAISGPIEALAGGASPDDALDPVRPNPARGTVVISFAVSRPASVRLSIVDLLGRQVALIAAAPFGAGRHALTWSGRGAGAPPGRYFVRMQVDGRALVQPFALAR
jgi:hypothetical protein